jgi:hypothetical protein
MTIVNNYNYLKSVSVIHKPPKCNTQKHDLGNAEISFSEYMITKTVRGMNVFLIV